MQLMIPQPQLYQIMAPITDQYYPHQQYTSNPYFGMNYTPYIPVSIIPYSPMAYP